MKPRFGVGAPSTVMLIRLMIGTVFLTEGIQKFLYPVELGAGRFAKIGIPWPDVMGPFVATAETLCGGLIIVGLFTSVSATILLGNISVAIVSTKLPILLGQAVGPFSLPKLARYGFWSAMHESRTDLSMWLGCLFLLLTGAGPFALDAILRRRGAREEHPDPTTTVGAPSQERSEV